MIRTIATSFGPVYYMICNECRAESGPLTTGVQHSDDALPGYAVPNGWLEKDARAMGRGWRYVRLSYCPQCQVAPEYRKHAR